MRVGWGGGTGVDSWKCRLAQIKKSFELGSGWSILCELQKILGKVGLQHSDKWHWVKYGLCPFPVSSLGASLAFSRQLSWVTALLMGWGRKEHGMSSHRDFNCRLTL